MSVPQGIERLLTLAGTGPEPRAKVLADPLAAASEAGIELTDSERGILASTPREQLEHMADSLAKRPGGVPWGKIACGTIACAAATGLAGTCLLSMTATTGIRSDLPRPRLTLPDEGWLGSLEEALAQAKASNRAVMAVFPSPTGGKRNAPDSGMALNDFESTPLRQAVRDAGLLAVKVDDPWLAVRDRNITDDEQRRYEAVESPYEALLTRHSIKGKLPAVLFLAPDGSELSKLVQPRDEAQLIAAIKAAPAQLARWLQDRRVSEGAVRTAGVRPDVPEKR